MNGSYPKRKTRGWISSRTWSMRTMNSWKTENRNSGRWNSSVRGHVAVHCSIHLLLEFRKYFHILHRWTRSEDTLYHGSSVDLNDVIDIRAYPLFCPEYACSTPTRARGAIQTYQRYSPRRPPTSECEIPSLLKAPDLIASADI
jgi:hypothetical protein